jgi:hypothetical protein
MGSPVVYQTTDQQSYIALTHNADAVLDDNSTATVGHFSLIRAGECCFRNLESLD